MYYVIFISVGQMEAIMKENGKQIKQKERAN